MQLNFLSQISLQFQIVIHKIRLRDRIGMIQEDRNLYYGIYLNSILNIPQLEKARVMMFLIIINSQLVET